MKTQWQAGTFDYKVHLCDMSGNILATFHTASHDGPQPAMKHATLAAAAPDLLAACEAAAGLLYDMDGSRAKEVHEQLAQAVAKATGQSPADKCEKYQAPTDAEVAEYEADTKAAMDRMMKTIPLVSRVKKEHNGTNWKGVEKCPVCGGNLHMTHAAYNGHVWGECETVNCLAWME